LLREVSGHGMQKTREGCEAFAGFFNAVE